MTKAKKDYIEAEKKFNDALSTLMDELGYNYGNYTKKEIDSMIYMCCREYRSIWTEYILWVLYGDDKKAKTRALIKAKVTKSLL